MATPTTKKPAAKATPVKTVDDYLAKAPKDKRAGLVTLRKTIKAAAPKAAESISYGMPTFKQEGKRLAYFANWKDHYALYGMGSRFIEAHAPEMKRYAGSKGTIRFPADKPIPERLVTKLVKARIAELEKGR